MEEGEKREGGGVLRQRRRDKGKSWWRRVELEKITGRACRRRGGVLGDRREDMEEEDERGGDKREELVEERGVEEDNREGWEEDCGVGGYNY